MRYVKLGSTGLDVSPIFLGCMSFGVPGRGGHPWSLDEEQARPILRRAVEAGVNFFDTANVYSDGTSEEIVGRALADFADRDEIVLATKVNGRMRPGPHGAGLSRKAIMTEIDHSLRRLRTDYVDLYQIHRFDPTVPLEETLEVLHDVVRAGRHGHDTQRHRRVRPPAVRERGPAGRRPGRGGGAWVPMAQVALAWVLRGQAVTAPIVGVSRMRHLDDALAAAELVLDDEEVRRLEEPYVPHAVAGF